MSNMSHTLGERDISQIIDYFRQNICSYTVIQYGFDHHIKRH